MPVTARITTASQRAAWILAGLALFLSLYLHLLPALFAGLLVHALVHALAPQLARRLSGDRARLVAVGALSALVIGLVTLAIVAATAFFRSDVGNLPGLLQKMAEIIDGSRAALPTWLSDHLPNNAEDLKAAIVEWLRTHASAVQIFGKEAGRTAAHILVGMILGGLLALNEVRPLDDYRPLAAALMARASRLAEAFRNVVFAQVRISALNTALTAIYLALVLPLAGISLPLTKTLIAVTFIAGLLPVIGKLISNTVIVVVSLAHSPQVAAASLAFLVVIHKLEYFVNARIVGAHINARAWELLSAMLVMEAAFGLAGLIAAPIFYAYLKNELVQQAMV